MYWWHNESFELFGTSEKKTIRPGAITSYDFFRKTAQVSDMLQDMKWNKEINTYCLKQPELHPTHLALCEASSHKYFCLSFLINISAKPGVGSNHEIYKIYPRNLLDETNTNLWIYSNWFCTCFDSGVIQACPWYCVLDITDSSSRVTIGWVKYTSVPVCSCISTPIGQK